MLKRCVHRASTSSLCSEINDFFILLSISIFFCHPHHPPCVVVFAIAYVKGEKAKRIYVKELQLRFSLYLSSGRSNSSPGHDHQCNPMANEHGQGASCTILSIEGRRYQFIIYESTIVLQHKDKLQP